MVVSASGTLVKTESTVERNADVLFKSQVGITLDLKEGIHIERDSSASWGTMLRHTG